MDSESVARLMRFTRDKAVSGVTILGVLGEADKLTDRERNEVIVVTIEAAEGTLPICVGTTHAGTDACIALSRRAAELGASAVMVHRHVGTPGGTEPHSQVQQPRGRGGHRYRELYPVSKPVLTDIARQ